MKFAANLSLMYTELPLLERFQAAKDDGFEAVEIQFPYTENVVELQQALLQSGTQCVLINIPAGDLMSGGAGLAAISGKESEFIDAIEQCIPFAKALNVRCVNLLAGRCYDESLRPAHMAQFCRSLEYAAQRFALLGITVTFEALNTIDMPHFLLSSMDDMDAVLQQVTAENVKVQFDVYHMAMMGFDVLALLEKHSKQIGHIQFADVPGRGEPGSGKLDFDAIFNAIRENGYSGVVSAEYKPNKHTSESLNWLKRFQNNSI